MGLWRSRSRFNLVHSRIWSWTECIEKISDVAVLPSSWFRSSLLLPSSLKIVDLWNRGFVKLWIFEILEFWNHGFVCFLWRKKRVWAFNWWESTIGQFSSPPPHFSPFSTSLSLGKLLSHGEVLLRGERNLLSLSISFPSSSSATRPLFLPSPHSLPLPHHFSWMAKFLLHVEFLPCGKWNPLVHLLLHLPLPAPSPPFFSTCSTSSTAARPLSATLSLSIFFFLLSLSLSHTCFLVHVDGRDFLHSLLFLSTCHHLLLYLPLSHCLFLFFFPTSV